MAWPLNHTLSWQQIAARGIVSHAAETPVKTQYYTATSLDGFIATEDDSLDWLFPLGNLGESSYPGFAV